MPEGSIPKQTISWVVKQISTNSEKLKSYKTFSLTMMELNWKSVTEKSLNTWELNNTLLNIAWVKEEVSRRI